MKKPIKHNITFPGKATVILSFLTLLFIYSPLIATHNMGGHIRAEHISGTTYKITLTTYTDPAPAGIDRCTSDLEIWSLGASPTLIQNIDDIPRRNGPPLTLPPSDCQIANPLSGTLFLGTVKKNIYDTTYTFSAPGTYEIRYSDLARSSVLVNINGADGFDMYMDCRVVVPAGNVTDNPPLFLNENLYDMVCVGQTWTHNPGGFDPDGDSLVYSLRPCYYYSGTGMNTPSVIPSYLFPDNPMFGISTLSMDSLTGIITWDSPLSPGMYALAYQVDSYRNGSFMGRIIGETVISVMTCQLSPPILEVPTQLFTFPGDTLIIPVLVYNNSLNDSLYLEFNNAALGNNGLFSSLPFNMPSVTGLVIDGQTGGQTSFNSIPFSTFNSGSVPDTIKAAIAWIPDCSEIGKTYQLDLWAHNILEFNPSSFHPLVGTYKSPRITVLPPAPENVTVALDTITGEITLAWDSSICFPPDSYNIYLSTVDSLLIDLCGDTSLLNLIGQIAGSAPLNFTITPQNLINTNICFYITTYFPAIGQSCLSLPICIPNYTTSLEENLSPPTGPFDFQIYDLNGRLIRSGVSDDGNVQLTHLPKGIYLIHLKSESGQRVKKVANW
ncbi:MAG: T9SS type A sorting domain-containing protein [Bacteroidetes bacterium]|nr:T9SS type A sorting domain-containing protein [Bacteroidota bacterium]